MYKTLDKLKQDTERLRWLAIQEEGYVVFGGELEGDDFKNYHKKTQEVAFLVFYDRFITMKSEFIWDEVVSIWGEDYIQDVWLKDTLPTESIKQNMERERKECLKKVS